MGAPDGISTLNGSNGFTVVVLGFPLNLYTKLTETPMQIFTTFPSWHWDQKTYFSTGSLRPAEHTLTHSSPGSTKDSIMTISIVNARYTTCSSFQELYLRMCVLNWRVHACMSKPVYLCGPLPATTVTPLVSSNMFWNFEKALYVSFIGLRLTKTSLTLINRTRLRTKGQSAGYPQAQIGITSNSFRRRAP